VAEEPFTSVGTATTEIAESTSSIAPAPTSSEDPVVDGATSIEVEGWWVVLGLGAVGGVMVML
jgi:hypothetical protein